MKAYEGVDVYSHIFLTSALFGGEWWALRPGRCTPQGKEPPVPIGLEAVWAPEPVWTTWRRDKSCPYLDSPSDPSAVQHIANRCADWGVKFGFSALSVFQYGCGESIWIPKAKSQNGQYYVLRNFFLFCVHLYYSGDQIKDDEVDRTCNTHEGNKKFVENFSRGRRWEDNIRKVLIELAFKGVDLIHLAQDSVHCGRFSWT
jgi:hypothetical protein